VEGTGKAGNPLDAKRQNGNGMDQPLGRYSAGRKPWSPPKQPLEPEKSAALRDRLLGEIGALASEEQATAWAQKAMAAKNTLGMVDCGLVETAFAARLAELADGPAAEANEPAAAVDAAARVNGEAKDGDAARLNSPMPSAELTAEFGSLERVDNAVAWHIDKGALTVSEPRRYRDRAHLRFVSAQPCLICGRRPSDAHHLRFAQARALGRRVSDEYAVPLCRTHHRVLHRHGNEAAWWETGRAAARATPTSAAVASASEGPCSLTRDSDLVSSHRSVSSASRAANAASTTPESPLVRVFLAPMDFWAQAVASSSEARALTSASSRSRKAADFAGSSDCLGGEHGFRLAAKGPNDRSAPFPFWRFASCPLLVAPCTLQVEVRCVEIVLPGNAHQGEQRIAPSVSQSGPHPPWCRHVREGAYRPIRGDPLAGGMRQNRRQGHRLDVLVDGGCLQGGNPMLPQSLPDDVEAT
jgi:hypothetical protein